MEGSIYNRMSIEDGLLIKVSTTTVAFNVVAATTLYTVPVGKAFILLKIFIRAGADAGATTITVGQVGALTDWVDTRTLSNLDAADDTVKIDILNNVIPSKSKVYAAGTVLQIDVTTALGGAINYVDLFGYLI